MLRWLGTALFSSVGRKIVMGLTGLLLVGFLIEHLAGNLTLFQDSDGTAFNEYKEWLESFGPLLKVAEVGLFLLFASHIAIALKLSLENREARKQRYVIRSSRGQATAASLSMLFTGSVVMLFLIKHVGFDFRFNGDFHEAPAAVVKDTLASPVSGFFYVATMGILGFHLAHGFRSAFQSLGLSHPKLDPLLDKAGIGLAVALAVGFASFPIYYLFFWTGGATS
ncbi:MAG: succinate dehydrogenase cytochrome b subunit [Planctomycetota bacterium]